MGCSLQDSVHGIIQARTLEWVAIFFSKGSSNPGIEPRFPALAGRFFFLPLSHLGSPDREINNPLRINPPTNGRNNKVTATYDLERITLVEFGLRTIEFPIQK